MVVAVNINTKNNTCSRNKHDAHIDAHRLDMHPCTNAYIYTRALTVLKPVKTRIKRAN